MLANCREMVVAASRRPIGRRRRHLPCPARQRGRRRRCRLAHRSMTHWSPRSARQATPHAQATSTNLNRSQPQSIGTGARQDGTASRLRLCRERPLRLRMRRYGPHAGRPTRRGTSASLTIEGDGQAQAIGRSAGRPFRACRGGHGGQWAFTTCDVMPMDKTIASEAECVIA